MKVCGGSECVFSKNAVRILSPFSGHGFVARNWALLKFLSSSPECGPDFEPIFRPRFLDHFQAKSVDRSRIISHALMPFLLGGKRGRPRPSNHAPLLAHAGCPQQEPSLCRFI